MNAPYELRKIQSRLDHMAIVHECLGSADSLTLRSIALMVANVAENLSINAANGIEPRPRHEPVVVRTARRLN
jgi:hypothetical protein